MTTTDRTPIILALLSDLVRERVLRAYETVEPDADLLHLSDGLALAVDHRAVAATWPPSAVDEIVASSCVVTILGTAQSADGRDPEGVRMLAVARRLADVAASLLVRGDVHRAEAGALWAAAERLLGLQNEAPEQADRERLQAEIDRLKTMHTEKRIALRDALGLTHDNHDHAGLCERVAAMRAEWDDLRRRPSEMKSLRADLASMTEQRDILKQQLEELRTETRAPVLSQPRIVESGGPIWVRVADTSSKHFGVVGRLEGVEFASKDGEEMWSVDLGGIANVRWQASLFVVVGAGRASQPPSNSTPFEPEPNPDSRDSYRSTVLRAGAKDCALFIGPGARDLTFVVEMRNGCKVFDVVAALEHHHGLAPESYRIREVRTETTSNG